MKITVHERISFQELEVRLRQVPLKQRDEQGNPIFVYRGANIGIRHIKPDEVNPTTFYLLRAGLEFQRQLRAELLSKEGIDTFDLAYGIRLSADDGKEHLLIPPVVEVTPRTVQFIPTKKEELAFPDHVEIGIPVINDGAHRMFLAREVGENIRVIHISGADPNFPFYAHPNDWERIRVVDQVPANKREKKFYSREDCYALYRDFGVLGVGGPRSHA